MKNKLYILLIPFLALLVVSCKKSKDTEPVEEATTQNMVLHINPMVSSKPLNFYSAFTTATGQKFTLSMFRYYVSNIRLMKADGSEFKVDGKYLLVTPSTADYSIGQVPIGDYKGIKFCVGIDSATNHSDPTIYPTTNPLAIQSPAMHWSWNAGYIFTMIEGSCDTTVNSTDTLKFGQYSHGMFFHLGMDMLYRSVNLSSSFSVNSENAKVLTIQSDINKFFTNIDLKKENGTHTMGTMPLATKAADNIAGMFSIVP
jgi:hypothetical protein